MYVISKFGYVQLLKGKVQLVSAYGIHQLHIFIFVLALVHVTYCVATYALGKLKVINSNFIEMIFN